LKGWQLSHTRRMLSCSFASLPFVDLTNLSFDLVVLLPLRLDLSGVMWCNH
jgi:hypothetical protein